MSSKSAQNFCYSSRGVDIPKQKRGVISLTYIYGIGRSRAKEILETRTIQTLRFLSLSLHLISHRANDFNNSAQTKIIEIDNIPCGWQGLDCGPKSKAIFHDVVQKCKTILWNGPAGFFENDNFANGSIKIAEKIIKNNKSNKIYSVAGGGDTVSLLNNLNAINNFNFVSTAGGAFLEYLEGKELPGIKALN